jgi:hypothetical protein
MFCKWAGKLRKFQSGLRPLRLATLQRFHLASGRVESLETRILLSRSGWAIVEPPTVAGPGITSTMTVAWQGDEELVQAGSWIVDLTDAAAESANADAGSLQELVDTRRNDVTVIDQLGESEFALIQTPFAVGYDELYASLRGLPGFEGIQPNFIYTTNAIPNDTRFGETWGMNNTGQTGGLADADIDAPAAWDISTGNGSVVVGVIDTGIAWDHPDLAANVWTNPGETAADGIDNDANGYVDDIHGYDFVNNDGNPYDDHGHGTHVSGTIAAVGNNGVGVAGVNWNAKVMGLKFLDTNGSGNTANAIRAVSYATMMRSRGINIPLTNNSWGGGAFDTALMNAIADAGTANMLFVASAGNNSANSDTSPSYPAAYNVPNIISVAATDHGDLKSSFSNYGLTSVDIGAPGTNILSTSLWTSDNIWNASGYTSISGTSMASPHVAGVAALAWGLQPTASYQRIRDAIYAGGDPIASMAGITVTGKRLNALGTLQQLGLSVTGSTPASGQILSTPPVAFTIDFSNPYITDTSIPGGIQPTDLTVNGIAASSVTLTDADTATFHFNATPVTAEGAQTMSMAAGAVSRASDNSPLSAWSSTFRYDALSMQVVSTTPANGSGVSLPLTTIDVTFNEPFAAASLGVGDLVLSQGSVTAAQMLNASTARFTVGGLTSEGVLTMSMPAAAVTDANGNPIQAYSGSLILDVGNAAFPTPMAARAPLGSLVYSSQATNVIGPSDSDTFTLNLDAGQKLTLIARPGTTLRPTLQLRGPSDNVIASETASAAGANAIVQSAVIAVGGAYTITLSGADGTTGSITTQAIVNAAAENEQFGGPSNDSFASAQNVDPSFVALGNGAAVASVAGQLPLAGGTPVAGDDFESGVLSGAWTTYSSAALGRIRVTGAHGTAAGSFALVMDTNDSGATYNLNEAVLTVNLAGVSQPSLSFSQTAFSDEADALPTSFIGHANGDGVSISADGNTWHRVWQATTGSSGLYTPITVDLAAAAASAGITLGNNLKVKFQQYDNYSITTDGRAFDNVFVTTPTTSLDNYRFTLAAGDTATLAFESLAGSSTSGDLKLFDGAGNLLALSGAGPTNIDRTIADFTAPAAGTYYAQLSGNSGDYSLVITTNAGFDIEANGTVATAQKVLSRQSSGEQRVLGAINGTTGSTTDIYAVSLAAGATLQLQTFTPGDGAGEPANALNPQLRVLNSSSTQLALDDNSAPDGRNAKITYVASSAGTYYVEVASTATGATAGDYVLSLIGASAPAGSFTVAATTPANGSSVVAPTQISVDFSGSVLLSSLAASDLLLDGTPLSSMTAVDNNTATFTLPASLAIGSHTFSFAAGAVQDINGNSLAAFSGSFSVIAGPVARFGVSAVPASQPVGVPFSVTLTALDSIDNTATSFSGVVTLSGLVGSTSVPITPTTATFTNGVWTGNVTVLEPATGMRLHVVDSAAHVGDSNIFNVITDPNAPLVPDLVDASDTGFSATDNLTNLNNIAVAKALTFQVPGTVDGATVTVYADGVAIGSAVASSTTTIVTTSGTPSLADGSRVITARQTIPGQSESGGSPALVLTIDTAAPLAPAGPDLQTASDLGASTADNITSDNTPTFTLTGAAPYVRMYRDGQLVTPDYSNITTVTLPILADGAYAMTATAVDAAGNVSTTSLATTVTIDIVSPAASLTAPPINSTGAATYDFTVVYTDAFAVDIASIGAGDVLVTGPKSFSQAATLVSVTPTGNGSPRTATYRITAPGGAWDASDNGTYTVAQVATQVRDVAGNYRAAGSLGTFTVDSGPTRYGWSSIPGPQVVGVPFTTTLTALDDAGQPVTNFNGTASLSGLVGAGTSSSLVISEAHGSPDFIEFTNVGSSALNIGGWQVYIYDNVSYPAPLTPFTFPAGTIVAAGGVVLLNESGSSPGTFPTFYTGANIDWNADTTSELAVLVRNSSAQMVDFFAAASGAPASITNPAVIPATQWQGAQRAGNNLGTSYSYQRTGNLDHDNATDWSLVTTSSGTKNTGLTTPFIGGATPVSISPTSATFVNGVWSGDVTVLQNAANMFLRAETGAGQRGDSNTFNVVAPMLSFTLPADLNENAGSVNATLNVLPAPASDLVVTLSSSDAARLGVAGTVTIPAGQSSVLVPVNLIDNSLLDGLQQVTISAAAAGYTSANTNVSVHDDETAALTVTLPTSTVEGTGILSGTITASAAPTRDITIQLTSDKPGRATVPATVTLLAGQTSAGFTFTVLDNTLIDGTQTATVTAAADNWTSGLAGVSVQDNDGNITVTLPVSGWEGQTLPGAGTVRIGGTLSTALVVNLSSNDTTEMTLPATVTIPAGQTSATFNVTLPTDALKDNSQTATAAASASGLTSGGASILVRDANLDRVVWDAITGPKSDAVPFSATLRALNVADETIAVFTGPAALSATGQAGSAIPITPATATFAAGVWTGNVTVNSVDPAVTLRGVASGVTGDSNAFEVQPGAVASFQWGNVPSPLQANQDFPATLTAQDANGFTATGYNGTATLSGAVGAAVPSNMLGSLAHTNSGNFGSFTLGYAFTPTSNIEVTHVRSYFGSKVSIWTNTGTLLASQTVSTAGGTWSETALSTPLQLTAGTTYRIAAFNGGQIYYWRTVAHPTPSFATIGLAHEATGDAYPANTTSSARWFVDFRANVGSFAPVTISPTSATFTNGVWSGNVSVLQSATGMHLRVNDGAGHIGLSNSFDVIDVNAPTGIDLIDVSDSGVLATDNITNLNNATAAAALSFQVSGTVAGATVTLYADGTAIGSAIASSSSTLVATNGALALADGGRVITARQTLTGEPESGNSPALTVTVDVTVPVTPTMPDLQAASDLGFSTTDNVTNDSTPTFTLSGAAPAAPYVRLYHNSQLVTPDYSTGTAVTLPPTADGIHAMTAAAVDAAGNVSQLSSPLNVTINTTIPTASASAPALTAPGGTTYDFTVTYTDDLSVDVASLNTGDVLVTGPNAFSQTAAFVSVTPTGNGTPRTATYRITAPGGTWDGLDNGTYTLTQQATQVRDVAGNYRLSGSLGTFTVILSTVTHFGWSTMSGSQTAGVGFATTLTALDASDNPVSNFNGTVNLSGYTGTGTGSQTILSNLASTSSSTGTYTLGWSFTPTSNIQLTHVRSYFGSKVSIWSNIGTLLGSTAVSGAAGTWTETALSSPIQLQAGVAYRVGVYSANSAYYWQTATPTSSVATINSSVYTSADAFPTTTISSFWPMVDLRATVGTFSAVPVTPGTATFTNGVWTGDISVAQAAAGVRLRVNDGAGHVTDSNIFDVLPSAPASVDLLDVSDTGGSSTDDITRMDNSSALQSLQFTVAGTSPGATVTLYADGNLIGSAVASTSSTVVTTSGSTALAPGARSFTARQTVSGAPESGDSAALAVTIDTAAPVVDVVDVSPDPRTSGVGSIALAFSRPIAGFDLADLSLTRDGVSVPLGSATLTTSDNVNFTLGDLTSTTSVSGDYVLTVNSAGSAVSDALAGNALIADASDTWRHDLPLWLAAGSAAVWDSATNALAITGAATLTADPGSGVMITATGAAAALTIQPASDRVIHLAGLNILNGAMVEIASTGASSTLVLNTTPNIDGLSKLDIGESAMVVKNGDRAAIKSLIVSGYNNGDWSGSGMTSSSAANDATFLTTLGFASNLDAAYTTFEGVSSLDDGDVLIKYTYYGDADLNGSTDLDDFNLFLAGYQDSANVPQTWIYGDFDYTGSVDLDDFNLFLAAYQAGGNQLGLVPPPEKN